jgi:hypothetical protein
MSVGSYQIVIEDLDGNVVAALDRTSRIGRPAVGDEVIVEGQIYRVTRVRYEDDPEDRTVRRYMNARLFVRRPRPEPRRRDADGSRVLPFKPPRRAAASEPPLPPSAILPPSLVAVLAATGYRRQATELKARSRVARRLQRQGDGWFVAEHDPDELYRRSRLAKRHYGEWVAIIAELSGAETISWSCAGPSDGAPAPGPSGRQLSLPSPCPAAHCG